MMEELVSSLFLQINSQLQTKQQYYNLDLTALQLGKQLIHVKIKGLFIVKKNIW